MLPKNLSLTKSIDEQKWMEVCEAKATPVVMGIAEEASHSADKFPPNEIHSNIQNPECLISASLKANKIRSTVLWKT